MDIQITYKDGGKKDFSTSFFGYRSLLIPAGNIREIKINALYTVSFISACAPESPVYIRWINRFGGFDYYMFSGRKTYKENVSRGDIYTLADSEALDAEATRGVLPGDVSRFIACGAEGLNYEMWKFLKGVALSPEIWVYNTSRQLFTKVILQDTQIDWDTNNKTGTVDFEFQLIDEAWMV